MDYDAFTGGVGLGGLRSRSDIKILLCYVLKSAGVPVPEEGLCEALNGKSVANFFEIKSALTELVSAGLINETECDGKTLLHITDEGAKTAARLETDLSLLVRQTGVSAALEALSEYRSSVGVDVATEKNGDGFNVIMSITGENTKMLSVTLFAADSLQAETIEKSFRKNPAALYSGIIELLTQ